MSWVGTLTTIAFERYAADLAMIAPDSVEHVFEHHTFVDKTREGIRAIGPPRRGAEDSVGSQWIDVCGEASVGSPTRPPRAS